MNEKDAEYIWNLMPKWIKEQPEELCPTMYGTLTRDGDIKVSNKVKSILGFKHGTGIT